MSGICNGVVNGQALAEDLRALVRRAEQGDTSVLPQLRRLLDETPALWEHYGDLARHAEQSWLALVSGPNLCLQESLQRQLGKLRAELAGETPTPLERLLVDRILACWLQVHYADAAFAQLKDKECRPAQLRSAAHLQDRAHHRYLTSIRQLATVRKLLRPPISPFDIATRLEGKRAALPGRRGCAAPSNGVAVLN
jgi:hypothetical protein